MADFDNAILYAKDALTDNFMQVKIDSSGDLITIGVSHHKIHAGEFFYVRYTNLTLAGAASNDVLVVTGDKSVHVRAQIELNDEGIFYMYEGTTVSDNGTELTAINANRTSSNTPELTAYHTPTITGVGTPLGAQLIIGSGSGQNAVGSAVSSSDDLLILAPNTNYLFRLTNRGAETESNQFFGFYEI